ncbi:amino acid ABC transporter substrate-binding protein [Azospirillum sp. TSH58]|uniref:substrate-binding periplasmic protein n=1 Tax=Azospirillum sp. TSH58 TaxID=664962 RepID=UPI000D5FFFC8|nr:transporter substrate-binding domain-containing protein [Azospirillum sp. TSH58]AWJ84652.1 amino acid ABC transporter substrate-binding protein [Azospirillum sp. TSH58]
MVGRRGLLAMLLLLAALGPVRAATPDSAPIASAPLGSALHLVTGNDFAPFTGEDLPEGGLLTEIVRRAFDEVGLRYGVRFMPWRRGYDGVLAGKFLGTFPYVRTPDREMEMLFSDPLLEVRQLVYLSAHSGMVFRKPEDFRGRTVCAPVGYALPPELAALAAAGALTRESPADLPACVRMAASGRVDAFVIDEFTGRSAVAKAMMGDEIRVAPLPYARAGQHLILSRSLPEAAAILAAFNAGLRKLKDGGAFEEILRRHLSAAP